MINKILTKFREAKLFEFLASLPLANGITIKVCDGLFRQLNRKSHSWTTDRQLNHFLNQLGVEIDLSTVDKIITDLLKAHIIVQHEGHLMFKTYIVSAHVDDRKPRILLKSSASDQTTSRNLRRSSTSLSASANVSSQTNQSTSYSQEASVSSNEISSSVKSHLFSPLSRLETSSLETSLKPIDSRTSTDSSSPLSSYFSSVNETLNDGYFGKSNKVKKPQERRTLKSSSIITKSSTDSHRLNSGKNISSAKRSITTSRSSNGQKRLSQSMTKPNKSRMQLRQSQTKDPRHKNLKAVARAMFNQISFISLLSHDARVRKMAQTQFQLIAVARKYRGIQHADDLFKYEFKMNYQKYGKIGNRINNLLMDAVSDNN